MSIKSQLDPWSTILLRSGENLRWDKRYLHSALLQLETGNTCTLGFVNPPFTNVEFNMSFKVRKAGADANANANKEYWLSNDSRRKFIKDVKALLSN